MGAQSAGLVLGARTGRLEQLLRAIGRGANSHCQSARAGANCAGPATGPRRGCRGCPHQVPIPTLGVVTQPGRNCLAVYPISFVELYFSQTAAGTCTHVTRLRTVTPSALRPLRRGVGPGSSHWMSL